MTSPAHDELLPEETVESSQGDQLPYVQAIKNGMGVWFRIGRQSFRIAADFDEGEDVEKKKDWYINQLNKAIDNLTTHVIVTPPTDLVTRAQPTDTAKREALDRMMKIIDGADGSTPFLAFKVQLRECAEVLKISTGGAAVFGSVTPTDENGFPRQDIENAYIAENFNLQVEVAMILHDHYPRPADTHPHSAVPEMRAARCAEKIVAHVRTALTTRPPDAEVVKEIMDAKTEWQISRATGNPDLEHEKATALLKAISRLKGEK